VDDKLLKYEHTRDRVLARIVELRAERRRMNALGVAAVVAALVARAFGVTPMIIAGIVGASFFFVGHYIVFAHIHESGLSLAQLRETIAALRSARGEPARVFDVVRSGVADRRDLVVGERSHGARG
jgi:hypothetical protein